MLQEAPAVEAPTAPEPRKTYDRPLGADIDRLLELRDAVEAAEEIVKDKKAVYDAHAALLFERMASEETTLSRGTKARATIKETVVAKVENWDEFYKFIRRTAGFHLLQRRVSDAAYRELLAQRKNGVPGVAPFAKKTLTVTAI